MAPLYSKLNILGAGSYGRAWVVKRDDTTTKKVLKEIDLKNLSSKAIDQALIEVTALAKCKHENIIRYTEAFVDKDKLLLSIVMEYASEGDLHRHISQRRGIYFPNQTILIWLNQLLLALSYIHSLGILHRDIKPQNIFLDEQHTLKLGDFGISRILESKSDVALTVIGTPFYLSPEICQQKPYNFKSDMWAAGCVLYELCCLHVPFTAPNLPSLTTQIVAGLYKPLPSHCASTLSSVVVQLLKSDPNKRPSAEELLNKQVLRHGLSEVSDVKCMLDRELHHQRQNRPRGSDRKRPAGSPLSNEQTSIHDKHLINSKTYTVVRHPKLRRLSPGGSPEITLLLERQRRASPHAPRSEPTQPTKGARQANKSHKKTPAPRLNLLQAVLLKSPTNAKFSDDNGPERIENQIIDFDEACCQQMTQIVYECQLSTSSSSRESAKSTTVEKLYRMLESLLGQDKLQNVLDSLNTGSGYSDITNTFSLGPSVVHALLWYTTFSRLVV